MNDTMYQVLLDRLASADADSTGGISVQDLLLQIGDVDPRMGLLTRILARRHSGEQAQDTSSDGGDDDAEHDVIDLEPTAEPQPSTERRQWLQRLRSMVTSMYKELEQLRERNDTLAAALGACYLCWGDDVLCEVCHGRGHPGALFPDPELFAQYVTPAVRRAEGPPRTAPHPPRTTDPQATNGASDPAERREE